MWGVMLGGVLCLAVRHRSECSGVDSNNMYIIISDGKLEAGLGGLGG